ncbi:MAG: hypothetical protein V4598_09855 [Bdellovibrionota bacterium]
MMFLLLFLSEVFACDSLGDQLNPQLKKKLDDYNKFIISLQNEKDPLKAINKRIQSHGLLMDAYINEKLVKNYPSSFTDDSISGSRKMFLRNTKLPPGLSNDIIYEISANDSTKPLRSWQIPANHTFQGIRGNEILHQGYLGTPCSQFKRDVLLAIATNGSFRAIPDVKFPEAKYGIKCPAAKSIFKGSDFGSCVEMIDVKSRKKRIIVFQNPMT